VSSSRTPAGDRVWFAQGLRGIAAMLVCIDHLFLFFWIQNGVSAAYAHTEPLDRTIDATQYRAAVILGDLRLSLGMLGVAVFFLISGFVIPMSLERLKPGRFLVARAFRIYPTYIAGLAIVALFVAFASGTFPWSASATVANASLLRDWTWSEFIAPVSWSLEIEIKFYVLCAVVVWLSSLARSRALVAVCAVGCGLAAIARYGADSFAATDLHLAQVAWVFADDAKYIAFMFVGVCFYNLFRGNWGPRRFAATSAVLLGLFVLAFSMSPQRVFWQHYAVGYGTALVIFTGCFALRGHLPYARPVNFLADISYPLYVVHQVVGFVLLTAFYNLHPQPFLNALEALACVIVIAWMMHRLVEVPSNRIGKRVANWRRPRRVPAPAAPAAASEAQA
jgi:peptidoglycan/LPS O-acetylase OafA/YrhL